METTGQSPTRWGQLTVARHRELRASGIDLHVFIDGVDVTARCRFADDTPGRQRAVLFALNQDGKKYVDALTNSVATEVITSGVEIVEGEPFN